MATLDLSLLVFFRPILVLVLVFSFMYAALTYTKLLGDSKVLHGAISAVAAVLVVLVPPITELVYTVTPWLTILFILFIMIIMSFRIFNVSEDSISSAVSNVSGLRIVIVLVVIGVFAGAAANIFGPDQLDAGPGRVNVYDDNGELVVASSDFKTNLYNTLYHPKVLGLAIVLGVSALSVFLMSGKMEAPFKGGGHH